MSVAAQPLVPGTDPGPFAHLGLLYQDPDDYLAGTVSFVHAALAADQPVLVAVPPANLGLIRDGLGGEAARVEFADMTASGRNPGRIIPSVLLAFASRNPDHRVSIIGEPIWPGRSRAEYPACAIHEALINAAFAGRNAAILCPYDVRHLPAETVADAYRTHPIMVERGAERPSSGYAGVAQVLATFNQPLPAPPPTTARFGYAALVDLVAIRRFVTGHATRAGLPVDRVADLAIAVNELATNTLDHTGAGGRVAVWTEENVFACEVTDDGHLADPLAGRIPRGPAEPRGRGLLLVNELCDLVRVHTRPGHTTIRLHYYL